MAAEPEQHGLILFKRESMEKILAEEKSQTRKLWDRPRAKEGFEHLFYLRPPMTGERPFARALITRVWRQQLGHMGEEEARAEGYASVQAFLDAFQQINGRKIKGDLRQVQVYAVEFQFLDRLS